MAIDFFHIRESDYDLLYQLVDVEQGLHPGKGMSLFEIYSYIRYGRVYAAVDGDDILGCVYFLRDFENPGKVMLYGVTVIPEMRGKRLGESLILSALADMKDSAGVRMAEVCVNPRNSKAMATYTDNLGFNIINVDEDTDIEDEDFVVLRKTL